MKTNQNNEFETIDMMPSKPEEKLNSKAFTLNHIWLQDHPIANRFQMQEKEIGTLIAAETD